MRYEMREDDHTHRADLIKGHVYKILKYFRVFLDTTD